MSTIVERRPQRLRSKDRHREQQRGRRPLVLRWGGLGIALVAVAASAYVLLGRGGGSSIASRPYVGGDLHSLVVDPTNAERVLVGGHDGGAFSSDGGRTWQEVSGLKGADAMGWAVNPRDPSKMYIGGHPGFYRSLDEGRTWVQDNGGLPGTDLHGLGIDSQDPNVLYAYVAGRGIYRSPDAGHRWELVNASKNIMGPILVDPRQSVTLYLAEMQGFQKSEDGGKTWQQLGTIPGGMAMWIAQDQQSPDTFYAANGPVLKSADGGATWRPTGPGIEGQATVVAVAPTDSRVVYAGVLEGSRARIFRSDDAGQSWRVRT